MKYLKILFRVFEVSVMLANAFFLGAIAYFLKEIVG